MSLFTLVLVIASLVNAHSEPCLEYGCPGRPHYEPFVPAPPGHTPNCAKPGQTFCESLDHYPRQLIKFLVDKCSFDFSSVLKDESRDDFNVYRSIPDYPQGYDYPPQGEGQYHSLPLLPPTQYPVRGQPAFIYGTPSNDTHQNGYRYTTPAQRQNPFLSDPTTPVKYHPTGQRGGTAERPFYTQPQALSSFGQNQAWWANRYARSSKIVARTAYENPLLKYSKLSEERKKRQANNLDAIPLCPTEPQYIAPRAALNNQGNWMYVVNLQDQNQKYSQVVKSERCTTNVCNGICSVPAGYTSRCQQQYVQKRLVALEGSGNQLYTDIFWFPHGCSCQIIANY